MVCVKHTGMQSMPILGGSGGMPTQEILKNVTGPGKIVHVGTFSVMRKTDLKY